MNKRKLEKMCRYLATALKGSDKFLCMLIGQRRAWLSEKWRVNIFWYGWLQEYFFQDIWKISIRKFTFYCTCSVMISSKMWSTEECVEKIAWQMFAISRKLLVITQMSKRQGEILDISETWTFVFFK